jgi:hypothetical protein
MLEFTVNVGEWSADEFGPYTGDVAIAKPSRKLLRLAAHAHAAGAITVRTGLDLSHVQSQEEGEREYARAQADGRWQEGNREQHVLDLIEREGISALPETEERG